MCLSCVVADFPIAEKVIEGRETPAECSSNFRKCVSCGCKEMKTVHYVVADNNPNNTAPLDKNNSNNNNNNNNNNGVMGRPNSRQTRSAPVLKRTVNFKHVCRSCGHIVAEHSCSFRSEGSSREVDMTCMLCGTFEDCYTSTGEEVRPEILTR